MTDKLSQLPTEPADRLTAPFMRFVRIEAMAGTVLLISCVVALGLANTPLAESFLAVWDIHAGINVGNYDVSKSLKHWINDGLMTIFFFVIALEMKRELVLGELRHPRVAALPFAAAIGGMIVPVGIFLAIAGDGPGAHGWGTVMSTDTAFLMACLLVLGPRIPISLRLFLLSLAIFDDVGAILIVAIAYSQSLHWVALGLAVIGLAGVAAAARLGIRSILFYFAMGTAIWFAVDLSGIHATLTGVILGLMTPARSWVSDSRLHAILDRIIAYPPGEHWSGDTAARDDLHRAAVATREALSPIERIEFFLHPWVAFCILPLFALANAGVPLAHAEFNPTLTVAIVVAFLAGKPAGVILFSLFAVKLGLGIRPSELTWPLLAAGSLLTGIGFTMALFIADLAMRDDLLNPVKLGILGASVGSAVLGLLMLFWLTARLGPEQALRAR